VPVAAVLFDQFDIRQNVLQVEHFRSLSQCFVSFPAQETRRSLACPPAMRSAESACSHDLSQILANRRPFVRVSSEKGFSRGAMIVTNSRQRLPSISLIAQFQNRHPGRYVH
jgi:hypothetical protein